MFNLQPGFTKNSEVVNRSTPVPATFYMSGVSTISNESNPVITHVQTNTQLITDNTSKFGSSIDFFNTSNSQIYLNNDTSTGNALAFGLNDFTISLWLKLNASSSGERMILDFRPSGGSGVYINWSINDTGILKFYPKAATTAITASTAIQNNVWTHVALSRSKGITRQFINGVQEGISYADTNNYVQGANRPMIGRAGQDVSVYPIQGQMEDILFINGFALYTAPFEVPTQRITSTPVLSSTLTTPYVKPTVYVNFEDDKLTDLGAARLGQTTLISNNTVSTFTLDTSTKKIGSSSYRLAGTATRRDFVFAASPFWAIGNNDFTIQMWVSVDSAHGEKPLFDGSSGNGAYPVLAVLPSGVLAWYVNGAYTLSGTTNLFNAGWMHVAASRKNGILKLFVNGIQEASGADTVNYLNISGRGPYIGNNSPQNAVGVFSIDEFVFHNGTGIFSRNFIPAVLSYDSLNKTTESSDQFYTSNSLLVNADSGLIDLSVNATTFTNSGVSVIDDGISNKGLLFNNQTLVTPTASRFAFGTGDFTIEFSFKTLTKQTEFVKLIQGGADWGSTNSWHIFSSHNVSPGKIGLSNYNYSQSAAALSSSISIIPLKWYHVALVQNSAANTLTLYVDGISAGAVAIKAFDTSDNYITIGSSAQNCIIDNLRVTKGVARYTSNFVPPASIYAIEAYPQQAKITARYDATMIGTLSLTNNQVNSWSGVGGVGGTLSASTIKPTLLLNAFNGKPGIRFGGVLSNKITLESTTANHNVTASTGLTLTLAQIYYNNLGSAAAIPISIGSIDTVGGFRSIYLPGDKISAGNSGSSYGSNVDVPNGSMCIITIVEDTVGYYLYLNGIRVSNGSIPSSALQAVANSMRLGYCKTTDNTQFAYNGIIGEAIVHNAPLSAAEVKQLADILIRKWS
jgi:hypothetical protein